MAGTGIASTGIVLEALRKDNYENWSALVENYLVGQGLWHGIVEADPKKPDHNSEKDDEWIVKNAKALHAIQLACGSENLSKIRTFKKAREAWNHLKISFSEDVRAFPDIEQGHGGSEASYYGLHDNVMRGQWDEAKSLINSNPDDIFEIASSTGRTVLHIAVASGQEEIAKELVSMGNKRLLKMQDKRGYTALALAAKLTDNVDMAERMVRKGGKELLTIQTKAGDDDGKTRNDPKNDTNGDAESTGNKTTTDEDGEEGETNEKKGEDGHDDGNKANDRKMEGDGVEDEDVNKGKGEIPVLLASASGHKKMTRYLFSQTPIDVLFDNGCHYCLMLLKRCISAEIFDIPALLLQHRRYEEIPLTNNPKELQQLVHALAHMPSSFPSEDDNSFSNSWADFIATHPLGRIFRAISVLLLVKQLSALLEQVKHVAQTIILRKLPGSEKIYDMKKDHHLVLEILRCLSMRISGLSEARIHECSAYDTMLQAAKSGIIEIIKSMRHANPNLLWAMDKNRRDIFSHAILNRQEKVYRLIHEIGGRREMFASRLDVFNNNLLHLAAELGPSSDLGSRSNAALQMQRELHWYMAVAEIVPPKCKEAKNADGKKPREVFTKNHEDLLKSGEKWARDTAGSFTLVGTLIITIMFAAAFTVPGGNDQNSGIPIFLKKRTFIFNIFILADAVSLITSSSSVLIFIGILTSRYAEKDFLRSLPLKLLFGLITLFFSVASMMIAFVSALSMMLKGYRGVVIAAMSLAIIPVLVLIPTLLTLSLEILKSTLKPNLLTAMKKKKKSPA
ncbi:hypothetical protein Ahy_B04g071831 isoform B [Arachis hypogaea]|uniref:PGG domain-containing protein n=1 Tax=Arachis hypogaea TaxID=3818 RepID=A0A444ZLR3_ARAHY|nr:hypothetical protein Ahy_B04g071831 isoform A [Arachis hypogaea]RYR15108.1 hypothetical protein Ahy_B04g071831 isoform B [Arachis hypogaea]